MENWPPPFLATMTYDVRANVLIEAISSSHTFIIQENTLRQVNLSPTLLSFDINMSFPEGHFSNKGRRYCYLFVVLRTNVRLLFLSVTTSKALNLSRIRIKLNDLTKQGRSYSKFVAKFYWFVSHRLFTAMATNVWYHGFIYAD